ncbi:hypothetical protein [Cystobacter fuscus]|uniref:hypothetical protein n=1 Tax=Cystobacter fuscus TaxID=43 RepID=UPI0012FE00F0|nr:hypothetical protein [Cystobacter fuscus]
MDIVNIAEFLFSRRAHSVPLEGLAEIFDELSWALDDECMMQIAEARLRWLEGDDPEKAHVALLMRDSFPCDTRERLVEVLGRIKARWPKLARDCDAVIKSWDENYPQGVV